MGQSVCLLTLKGDFNLNAVMAADIVDLVALFLAGLTERSQYAVALQEINRQGQLQLPVRPQNLIAKPLEP